MSTRFPVLLCVLDGWGEGDPSDAGNAIARAHTPHMDALMAARPYALLEASGIAVGLPEGQMGNSEVGHLHLAAGRVVPQDLLRIQQALSSGNWVQDAAWQALMAARAARSSGRLHVTGLLSDGGVHAHLDHWLALIDACALSGLRDVVFHVVLDGRDMPPRSAKPLLSRLQDHMRLRDCGQIATLSGRYYAMDRDSRWDRNALAADAMCLAEGSDQAEDVLAALDAAYASGIDDEFVRPVQIVASGGTPLCLTESDLLLHLNFRADRAGQMLRFLRGEQGGYASALSGLSLATMTPYPGLHSDVILFDKPLISDGLGACVSASGLRQVRIAETEKYAHVTYFFNGGRSEPYLGETRRLIPSPQVATYDLAPEMSAEAIADAVLAALDEGRYDFLVCNFANADMVGHTGKLAPTIEAVEAIDRAIGRLSQRMAALGGHYFITADHGNAESLYDAATGQAITAHTVNPVPFIYAGPDKRSLASRGHLGHVAPTVLSALGLPIPEAMTYDALWQV